MQRSKPAALSLLGVTSLTCGLVLTPIAPALAHEHAEATATKAPHTPDNQGTTTRTENTPVTGEHTLAGVHTNLVNATLNNGRLTLNSTADLPDGNEGTYDPAHTVFHLPNTENARGTVTQQHDFIAPEGTEIWRIPHNGTPGLLYPAWGAENIKRGMLKDDKISLELIDAKTPEGGSVEVFKEAPTEPSRMFSSKDTLPAYELPAGEQTHSNWAFTKTGTYTLTFRASAQLTDGTPVNTEQTYTIVVGDMPSNIFEQIHTDREQRERASAQHSYAQPGGNSQPRSSVQQGQSVQQREEPKNTDGGGAAGTETGTNGAAAQHNGAQRNSGAAPGSSAGSNTADSHRAVVNDAGQAPSAPGAPANTKDAQGEGAGSVAVGASNQGQVGGFGSSGAGSAGGTASGSGSVKGSNSANVATGSNNSGSGGSGSTDEGGSGGSEPEKCYATEVAVKDSTQSLRSPNSVPGTPVLVQNTTEQSGLNRATEGHFDVGPVLNGSTLTSAVKDDRFSPAKHVSPSSLDFVLGDAAKLKFPSGMEDVAPAGSTVHMIGATQQPNVPWLGWSTQDPELLKQADGPVTMSLKGFEGPGSMSVFLSGNFGSAGQKVFTSRGGSFQVPLNTHQHSNWVFTAEGRYRVTIGWKVKLKNGKTVESTSTLNFAVGNVNSPAPAAPGNSAGHSGGSAGSSGDKGKGSQGGTAPGTDGGASGTKQAGRGTVDEATGIVTKPDGQRVRIVGKTASGKDCALTNQELKDAQQAAAAGKLANTGAGFNPFMVSTSVLAVALGAVIVYVVRHRKRHAAQ